MEASLRTGWAIPRRILLFSAAVAVVLAGAFVGVLWLAGIPAALGLGMGFLAGTRPAISLTPRHAMVLAVPIALAGAVGTGLRGQPFAAACFVALCCVVVAPAEMRQDGLLAGLPTAAAVLVSVPGNYDPAMTAGWMIVGSLLLVGISVVAKFPRSQAIGTPPGRAWRHAAVMAASVGIVVYLVQLYEVPHGYWVAVTLTVVLRPLHGLTRTKARQRILGTVVGVVLALLLAWLLPGWGVAIALVACLVLMNSYAMLNDYVRQVLFLTPAVVLLAPADGTGLIAAERAIATVIGTLLAGALALLLERAEPDEPQASAQPRESPDR
ncbi:MAG: FUSC family protein [Propionibacteriaceae bacterium]|nr:FUSC family protein [Propionibacteriaceae bacterium]